MDEVERDRLVAWLVAEFEVQNGIDVTRDESAIGRLRDQAERMAHETDKYEVNCPFLASDATGPKHFHVVVAKKRIDDIREGREGPPHVERKRRSVPPPVRERRTSDPPKASTIPWLIVALVLALAGAAMAFTYAQSSSKHTHGEHDKR